jgi:hypothetical protein
VNEEEISARIRFWQLFSAAMVCAMPLLVVGCGSTGVANQQSGNTTISATVIPTSLSFSNVTVGTSGTKTVAVTNTGTGDLVVSSINVTGASFSISGITFPLTVAPGATYTANVVFHPQAIGTVNGSASIASNLSGSPTVVSFSGTGVAAPTNTLTVSPTSIAFGNVTVGTSSSRNVTLSNNGTAGIVVSAANVTGLGFSIAATTPFTVAAGASSTVSLLFSPQTSGPANGTASFVSNASNSPGSTSFTGTGVVGIAHSVDLSWTASTSTVSGYNIYRGSQTGGPYQLVNASLQSAGGYVDGTVASGQTYFYVVTAVDSTGTESAFSNEATAAVPTP